MNQHICMGVQSCTAHFSLRLYLQMVEPFIPAEGEFLTFLTQLRAVYDSWLRGKSPDKFNFVSLQGTLAGTLEEVSDSYSLSSTWSSVRMSR